MTWNTGQLLVGATIILIGGIALVTAAERGNGNASPTKPEEKTEQVQTDQISWEAVRSTVNRRCVVCHGCYDAPCQLNLGSADGVRRGASKQPVYHASRLSQAPLTRLGIDAETVDEWRTRGFFDVTQPSNPASKAPSILRWFLEHGRNRPLPEGQPLPKSFDLDIAREMTCPTRSELGHYKRKHPFGGMPYGTAPLQKNEADAMIAWAAAGAPTQAVDQFVDSKTKAQIDQWEEFLNRAGTEAQIVARYIYEHLFLAHLHFETLPGSGFFKLVRSTTAPGTPISLIATRRPYDDPGVARVFYRIRPLDRAILYKTHITYELSESKLAVLEDLFMDGSWAAAELPPYKPEIASNPFIVFADIPPLARYRFLLNDAEFFIRSFIRGPVCRGQVAVSVIEDRFWVMFVSPGADLSVTNPSFLKQASPFLGLPQGHATPSLRAVFAADYFNMHRRYTDFRRAEYEASDPNKEGPSADSIWRGNPGGNPALLTVFRHVDNATVVPGFVGEVPETAWVVDYPTLERIYYNLVAGFDVYGSVTHQVASRMYMDLLRMESEDLFLSYMPPDSRAKMHAKWYRGAQLKIRTIYKRRAIDVSRSSQISYITNSPKAEFLATVLLNDESGVARTDPSNRPTGRPGSLSAAHKLLSNLSSKTGRWVRYLPDVVYLQIRRRNETDLTATMIRDKEHTNVAYLFAEDLRREPEKDSITLSTDLIGSYPNFFFVVDENDLQSFTDRLQTIRSREDWLKFVRSFGVRRTSGQFWPAVDFFHDALRRQDPVKAGIIDLNRYTDP